MKKLFLFLFFLVPALAHAFSVTKSTPLVTSGTSGNQAVVQVSQGYTFTGTAASLAAGSPQTVNVNSQYSIAGAPASNMAQAALGVGVAAAGLFASPAIGAVLGALTVGAAGYQLYQAMQQQGFKVNADGSATYSASSYTWNGATYSSLQTLGAAASGMYSCDNSSQIAGTPSGGFVPVSIYGFRGNPSALCAGISVQVGSVSRPATVADSQSAITNAVASPQVAADAAAFAQSRGLNPLSFLPTTAPNLASAPYSATLPDGTVVSVTPASTLGGSDTISPSPTSITNSAPAQNAVSSTVNNTSNITNITNNTTNTTPDICVTNPTASACADLGTAPVAPANPTGTIDVSGTNFNSIAFAGNSTCPAPSVLNLHSGNLTYSYQPVCDFMSVFKPIALAVAMFIAGLIMFGQRTAGNE